MNSALVLRNMLSVEITLNIPIEISFEDRFLRVRYLLLLSFSRAGVSEALREWVVVNFQLGYLKLKNIFDF